MKRNMRKIVVTISILLLCFAVCGPVSAADDGKIDINTAGKEELTQLHRIGPKTADAIIEYRQKTPFKSIEEIMEVKGIGQKTFDDIKDRITVGVETKKK